MGTPTELHDTIGDKGEVMSGDTGCRIANELIVPRLQRLEQSCDAAHARLRDHAALIEHLGADLTAQRSRLVTTEQIARNQLSESQRIQSEVSAMRRTIGSIDTQLRMLERLVEGSNATSRLLFERFDAHLLETRTEAVNAANEARDSAVSSSAALIARLDVYGRILKWALAACVLLVLLAGLALTLINGGPEALLDLLGKLGGP